MSEVGGVIVATVRNSVLQFKGVEMLTNIISKIYWNFIADSFLLIQIIKEASLICIAS